MGILKAHGNQSATLDRCPLCNYSLTGLPDRHACPECGFSYDRRMVVEVMNFRLAARIARIGTSFAVILLCLMSFRWSPTPVPLFVFVAIPLITLFGFAWDLWRRRRNNKILVWNDGIQVIRKGKPSPVYPWVDIASVKRDKAYGYAFVHLRDGGAVRLFGEDFFGSHKRTAQFVERLERCQDEFLPR